MARRIDRARVWKRRIDAADTVWKQRKVISDQLEDALNGDYPALIPGAAGDLGRKLNLRSDDQINVNLLLRAANYIVALAYDEFPSLRFSREPGNDDEAVLAGVRLVERLMDEGGAVYESRDAMTYANTRGPWAVFLSVQRDILPTKELNATTVEPGVYIEAALSGQPVEVPDGTDYAAVAEAARAVTETADVALGLQPQQMDALYALAEQMEVAAAKELEKPKPVSVRAKIVFDATPYGTWFLIDPSVSDYRRAGWVARKIVMNRAEFEREPMFRAAAVKGVIAALSGEDADAEDNQNPAVLSESTTDETVDEKDKISIWEIWDKVNEKRHYLCDGYDEFLEKSDDYPYMDAYGKPLFADFFPCVVRTPYKTPKEGSERALGLPWLEIGWPLAVEFIKLRSAAVIAAKKSARLAVLAASLSPKDAQAIAEGRDGTMIQLDSAYDKVRNGEAVTALNWPGMPMDYLTASKVVQADFASVMGLSLASLTSESVADTLGQEQIAMQGSNTTQGDTIRQYESGFAELAMKTLLLFRAYATETECAAYMGAKAHEPRQNPDGTPKPSIYEAFKATDFTGAKLICRFASGTRADDAVYIKQLQDFIALTSTLRDNTNTPYFDVRPLMERLGKAMDIEGLKPHEPTAAELAQIMAATMAEAMQQGGGGMMGGGMMGKGGEMGGGMMGKSMMDKPMMGDRESPGGGRMDGRRAGGGRGPAPVPGRQGRDRAPATSQNLSGQAQRPRTATS